MGNSIYRLLNVYSFYVLDVECLPGLTCAHFIAGIPKHEEGYENEYREQSGYDNKPLLMGQLIALTFQKGREPCFW
nr:hypothetical protein [uncultured Duncaniella sp.]